MLSSGIFYLSISLITAVMTELSTKVKGHDKKVFVVLSIFIPAFFAGIRYGIGTDYFVTYKPYYDYLSGEGALQLINRQSLEIGYHLLNLVVIKLGGNFQIVLFLASLLTFIAFRKSIMVYKDRLSVGLATFVFMLMYYQASFNIIRQLIAATIGLYAFHFIEEKKLRQYVIWVVIAAFFHKTAIIVMPFYLFINVLTKRKWKIAFFAFYIIFIFAIFNFDHFAPIAYLLDSSGYYASYFRKVSSFRLSLGLLIRTVPYLVSVVLMWNVIRKDKTMNIMLNSFLLGSIMRLIVYMTRFDADRIALYFLMSQVIFIPYLCKHYKKGYRNFFGSAILIGTTIVLWYFDFIYMGRNATVPYVTIFK